MRKAFTLVEMLIVVVVLVTLMTITFRLSSIGSDQTRRNRTISRLQRVENCLSGYMAAFGTYPPVRLQGSRNIYLKRDSTTGLQDIDGAENQNIWGWTELDSSQEWEAWQQVKAACRAQPVSCQFPFTQEFDKAIDTVSKVVQEKANSNQTKYKAFWNNASRKARLSQGFQNLQIGGVQDNEDWRETQVFQFGLMSFLLPRYLFMLDCDSATATKLLSLKQWKNNNTLPYSPLTGDRYGTWEDVRSRATCDVNTKNYAEIASIPSQAVCARWISNLEGICSCNYKVSFFGITVSPIDSESGLSSTLQGDDPYMAIYNSNGQQYILDSISVHDGWGTDFFYYSPAPYQTYTLWSAGPNCRTFPPWVDRSELDNKANSCVGIWIDDDIIHLSN